MSRIIIDGLARIANFEWNPKERRWNRKVIGGSSLSAAGAMVVLGKVFGISAVAHSSGAMILTGSAGYISGTFFAGALVWFIWPLLVIVGLVALFWKRIVSISGFGIRRLYFWRKNG